MFEEEERERGFGENLVFYTGSAYITGVFAYSHLEGYFGLLFPLTARNHFFFQQACFFAYTMCMLFLVGTVHVTRHYLGGKFSLAALWQKLAVALVWMSREEVKMTCLYVRLEYGIDLYVRRIRKRDIPWCF